MRKILILAAIASTLWINITSAANKSLTMIFAHGLAGTCKQATLWQTAHPFLHNGPIIAENFPDATEYFWRVHFPATGLGQQNEIEAYKQTIDAYREQCSNEPIILAGISRGAATVINYAALHQPKNIGALIVLSPFPSMRNVAQRIVQHSWLNNIPYMYECSPHLVGCIFWQYSDSGIHPIDVVANINPNIPVLFISIEHDHLIPSHMTQILVDKLASIGHTRVHHLVLNEGRHGKPIPGKEGKRMQRCVQAFLKHYQLPHDAHYARKGFRDFINTFPFMLKAKNRESI